MSHAEPFNDATERLARARRDSAYLLRHETPSLDTRPHGAEVFDYAGSAQRITQAMIHLDEGLPAGQTERVRNAYLLLRQGVDELGVWLRSRGVSV